jgi:hypothetical protein
VVRARALQGLGRRNEAREAARAAVEADASLGEQVAPILGR